MSGYHVIDILFDFSSCNAFNPSLIDKKHFTLTFSSSWYLFWFARSERVRVRIRISLCKRKMPGNSNIDYQIYIFRGKKAWIPLLVDLSPLCSAHLKYLATKLRPRSSFLISISRSNCNKCFVTRNTMSIKFNRISYTDANREFPEWR